MLTFITDTFGDTLIIIILHYATDGDEFTADLELPSTS